MKQTLTFIFCAAVLCASAWGADWKTTADAALGMPPAARALLERKPDKSAQDVYILTLFHYRDFQKTKLKKLESDSARALSGTPELLLLQGITLMWDHRHAESRRVLAGLVAAHPDFFPAAVTLAHLDYLRRDFERSYAGARRLIDRKKELSRFHLTVSLLVASGAKGVLAQRNLVSAIPAYFEVNGYLKEAQKQLPDSAEVLYALGTYHLLTPSITGGDLDVAVALLEQSRRLAPLNPGVYVRLAQAYRARGLALVSRQYLEQARAIDPQDELLLDDLSGEKVFLDVP